MSCAPADAVMLAEERAALRRLAELVARSPDAAVVLHAIATEACGLCGLASAVLMRFDSDESATIVALYNAPPELAVGDRWSTGAAGTACDVFRPGVEAPIVLNGRRWGMIAAPALSAATAPRLEERVAEFAELAATPVAAAQALTELRGLADEQAALRRVAELVAAGTSEATVFDAVAHEAYRLLGGHFTALLRYEPDGPAVIVGMDGADAVQHVMHIGMRLSDDGDGIVQRVQRSARAVRINSYEGVPGSNAATARELGLTCGVGAPVIVEGQVWGAITVLGAGPALPANAEGRLGMFAGLIATSISNAQTRTNLTTLAEEQSALRRVAEIMARGAPSQDIFDAVATEASGLLGNQAMTLTRFDGDCELVVVAARGGPAQLGTRIRFESDTLPDWVRREKRVVRIDDYTRERDSSLAASYGLVAAVAVPISVEAQAWGMLTATSREQPLPGGTESRLQQFAELVAAALANSQARDDLQSLADEQTALRRIAELTAQDAPADAVLNAVAAQASRLAGVEFGMILRFEPDGSTEIVALDGAPANFEIGLRAPNTGDSAVRRVWRTGRASRIDDLASMSGQWPRMASRAGFSASAGVPILLQARLWGTLIVVSRGAPVPPEIEAHLTDFAELVSTAISAAHSRAELRVLADEQTALRRVAELVARGAALDEVFAQVAAEASKLLGDLAAVLLRYDPGDAAVAVAVCNSPAPLGLRVPSGSGTATGEVLQTGRSVRVDSFAETPLADLAVELDVGAGVAVPVIVEGLVWGALTTSTPGPPLPAGTEERLAQFAELAAAAIASAENKAKLNASRARIIATADETRRRLQRDLHDGSQQRLVHALITLQLARDAALKGEPAAALIDEALSHARRANTELRDLVHGILPASLTRGGLSTGIESLISDLPMAVQVEVTTPRLPAPIETTAYFIVTEALTNAVKHARCTHASVEIRLEDEELSITVRDNGSGGADPARGSGLTGLLDRVEASAGTLVITSPPGIGTTLHATLTVT